MALSNDPIVADRMRRYRSHGITSEAGKMQASLTMKSGTINKSASALTIA